MPNTLVWADIPVLDLARARAFYSALLQVDVAPMPGMGDSVAVAPSDNGISVDLAVDAGTRPSATHGPTVYFSANGDIDGMLERATAAGGRVLQEKQMMGEAIGWIAFVEDTEGNRIGIQEPAKG